MKLKAVLSVGVLALLTAVVVSFVPGSMALANSSHCSTSGTKPKVSTLDTYGNTSCSLARKVVNTAVRDAKKENRYGARNEYKLNGYQCIVEKSHGKLSGGDCTSLKGGSAGLSWAY